MSFSRLKQPSWIQVRASEKEIPRTFDVWHELSLIILIFWNYPIPSSYRFNQLYILNYFCAFKNKQRLLLITFLLSPWNENPLTYTAIHAKKVIDSPINEEEFWVTKEDKLDEKKPPWLNTCVIADAFDVKGTAGVGFSETLTDISSDRLDKLILNRVDSGDDGDEIWASVDMIMWGAGKYENKIFNRFSMKS